MYIAFVSLKTLVSHQLNPFEPPLQVKLADRSLLPGDVVKFSDVRRGAQKGFISNVEVVASVKVLLANQIFNNVDCKDLSPLQVRCVFHWSSR